MGGSFKIRSWMGRNNKCTRWLLYLVNLFICAWQNISAGVHREHLKGGGQGIEVTFERGGGWWCGCFTCCYLWFSHKKVLESEKEKSRAFLPKCLCRRFICRRATHWTGCQSDQLGTESLNDQLTLTHWSWTTEDLEMNWRKDIWMVGAELAAFILACANSSDSWCQCSAFSKILLTQFRPLRSQYGPWLPVATCSRSQTLKRVSWARRWPHSPPVTFTVMWSQSKGGPTQF